MRIHTSVKIPPAGFGPENDQLGHTGPSSRSKRNSRSSYPLYGVHKSLWHRCGGSGGDLRRLGAIVGQSMAVWGQIKPRRRGFEPSLRLD